jgi:hypothetical protein
MIVSPVDFICGMTHVTFRYRNVAANQAVEHALGVVLGSPGHLIRLYTTKPLTPF